MRKKREEEGERIRVLGDVVWRGFELDGVEKEGGFCFEFGRVEHLKGLES